MMLKPSADFYRKRHPQPEDVFLLVEIADTTLERDQEEKLSVYARAGIAEVWIVILNDLTVEVYTRPGFTGYASKTVLGAGDKATPQAFPDAILDVAGLLKR